MTVDAVADVIVDVIADVDTGIDDALALLAYARSPGVRLLGVGCVAGNVAVDQVIANTRAVLACAGSTCPIGRGATHALDGRPLVRPGSPHGRDGLGGLATSLRDRAGGAADGLPSALDVYVRTLADAATPVAIAATGPLTNIARLLTDQPAMRERVAAVHLVGEVEVDGDSVTNPNVAADRAALDVLVASGVRIVAYAPALVRSAVVDDVLLTAIGTDAVGLLAGRLLARQRARLGTAALGDAAVAAAVLAPTTVRLARHAIGPTVDAIRTPDAGAFGSVFAAALRGAPPG